MIKDKTLFVESFRDVFGDWFKPLRPLIDTLYFENLILEVNDLYVKSEVFPPKGNVLRAFRLTPYKDVKVVILGQDPYPNERANGLAFANSDQVTSLSPALRKIRQRIEKDFYDGLKLDFDPTLESWAKQGVLLINTALTASRVAGSHVNLWKPFTEEVLEVLSREKEGLYFCLWGKFAQSFAHLIDEDKHTILKHEHPTAANYQGREWLCPHFKEIKDIKW